MTKQKLIEDNMNLVYWLMSREYPTYLHDEDLKQVGMVGLCMAAEKWDESKGKFSGFAYSCIRNAILNEFRNRNKHSGVLSLDYEVLDDDGKRTPLVDFIVGDEDVPYVDVSIDTTKLTELQRKIYELLLDGVEPEEIARRLNTTHLNVTQTRRKLRLLRKHAERKE